jgi:hypothetical protein
MIMSGLGRDEGAFCVDHGELSPAWMGFARAPSEPIGHDSRVIATVLA